MMVDQKSGFIVNISAGNKEPSYNQDVPYSLSKAAVNQMATFMAKELAPHGITSVSLLPGIAATEMVMARKNWSGIRKSGRAESPQFIGHCIAAFAIDSKRSDKNGQAFYTPELAEKYRIEDKWL